MKTYRRIACPLFLTAFFAAVKHFFLAHENANWLRDLPYTSSFVICSDPNMRPAWKRIVRTVNHRSNDIVVFIQNINVGGINI